MADKELTPERSIADFKDAYEAKRKLIEREKEDFLFALGKQWDDETLANYQARKIKAVTDNRIQPNIFLLTGLERQNRTDFKAFPEGEEDSLKAEIASALFKNAIKISDFGYKSSEQFKDGVTCGESHLELYLDYTYNILNGKPCWKKSDGGSIFPEPGYREYDFSDARYVYKLTKDLSQEDLISLYPEKRKAIEEAEEGKIDFLDVDGGEKHTQKKDYPTRGGTSSELGKKPSFDLLERYYKKWVEKHYVGDKKTGQIQEAESPEKAEEFVNTINLQAPDQIGRFIQFTRLVPEIWCYAHVPGMEDPLSDDVAWFYPKWKTYPFIPYFARFSTAPLTGDDSHLLVQGVVHGVKGVQEKHNKSESLKLLHLNSAANSGWLEEEGAWVDPVKVRDFGATPGINLSYKKGSKQPERIFPMPLSQAHTQIANESAEAIKAILGINADLLAVQEGGQSSGRAIALRQRQGLLMVQELFDNLSRSRQIAGRFLLSQLGEMYDTETAKKVLGESFLQKNFPPPVQQMQDSMTGQIVDVPATDAMGNPMQYDIQMADAAIAEVLTGDLGQYDVAVGEAVASETMRMANMADLKEIATTYPGAIPAELLIEESQLPQATKTRVLAGIKQAQVAAMGQVISPSPQVAEGAL